MKRSQLALALVIVAMGGFEDVRANDRLPASPFGIEMGRANSCEALNKKLISINPQVTRQPWRSSGGSVTHIPGWWKFSPANALFPEATDISVICDEDRLRTLWIIASNGVNDQGFRDTLVGLTEKYGSEDTVLSNPSKGEHRYYPSKFTSIVIVKSKGSKVYSLQYEFFGPFAADINEEKQKQDKDTSQSRKRAL